MAALQNATDLVDDAAAEVMGVNRTDLRILELLSRQGPSSASELADRAHRSRGAMTTALDRLERAELVVRATNREDRRGVQVELTALAQAWIAQIWGPLALEGQALVADFSTEELLVVQRFLERATHLQETHAERIRALSAPQMPRASASKRTGLKGTAPKRRRLND
jgi:DNA-binding MarR family transcriptional regulator